MLPSPRNSKTLKSLQVAIHLNDSLNNLELKWDGKELKLNSPSDAKVSVSLVDRVETSALPHHVSKASKVSRASKATRIPTPSKSLSKVQATQLGQLKNKAIGKKRTKKLSKRQRQEAALKCIRFLYAPVKEVGINDAILPHLKSLYVNHKGLNEKAMADICLLTMNAQFDRFSKNSFKNEEWEYSHGPGRKRVSMSDKKTRHVMSNKTPIYGHFEIAYDMNEDLLEFVKYVFSPLIMEDAILPDMKAIFKEKTYMQDDVLECIGNLYNGKLHRINYVEKPLSTITPHISHIVHQFDTTSGPKPTMPSLPVLLKPVALPKVQHQHKMAAFKTFPKKF